MIKVHFSPDVDKHGIPSSTGFYRSILPARSLRAIGHKAKVDSTIMVNYFDDLPVSLAEDVDVLVWQRPLHVEDVETMSLPFGGLRVVEADDDFLHLQDWSPLLVSYVQQDFVPLDRFKKCLRIADLITVTTPELAELYKDYCPNIKVLPNHVEVPVWELAMANGQRLKEPGKVSIGWAGWTHGYDLDVLMGAIEPVVNWSPMVNHNLATFTLVGWPEAAKKFSCPVRAYPWMRIDEYRPVVASFDIGLAPLKNEIFNRGKSWLKVLEYMACGVVPIASAWHADYSRLIKHGVNGFLARDKKEWREYIQTLVDDPDLRNQMRTAGRQTAWKYDNETRAGPLWAQAYRCSTAPQKAGAFLMEEVT